MYTRFRIETVCPFHSVFPATSLVAAMMMPDAPTQDLDISTDEAMLFSLGATYALLLANNVGIENTARLLMVDRVIQRQGAQQKGAQHKGLPQLTT